MKLYKDPQNNIFAYEEDGSQDYLIAAGMVQVTEIEARQIVANKTQQDFEALNYSQKRAAEYPSIGDQLDALWKGGAEAEAMLAKVQAVKNKYPKGVA